MIHFELVTLDGVKFGQEVHEVILPTPDGYIAVFPYHTPLVSLAVPGIVSIRRQPDDKDERMEHFAINGGVIEVLDNAVRVLVDEADRPEEINEKEAQEAYERAKQLKQAAKDQVSLDHAQALIDRQAVRLKLAELRRQRKR